ncbi:MAG: hypothetical protein PHI85_10590 [Victivallaceae bacterium]|nr:hypothetical protein [Victivallaceae bacterium]
MLKDRFTEACRSLDCACAIDFKDGGRLLSPLRSGGAQIARPWNYAVDGLQYFFDFGQAVAAASQGDLSYEIKLNRQNKAITEERILACDANLGLSVASANRDPDAIVIYVAALAGTSDDGSWTYVDTAKAYTYIGAASNHLIIKETAFHSNQDETIKVERIAGNVNIYLNDMLVGTFSGAARVMSNTSYTSAFNGFIKSITLSGANGVTYHYGNWESQHGLLTPVNAKCEDGKLVAVNTTQSSYVNTQIDLRGRNTDFTIVWRGTAAAGYFYLQGNGTATTSVRLGVSGGQAVLTFGDGTNSVSAIAANSTAATQIACSFDFTSKTVKCYADGVLTSTASFSAISAIYSGMSTKQLAVYAGCTGFAFIDRALTAEEVAAL